MKNYPKINIGVGGLIVKNDSKILFTQRKSNLGVWTIPSGYMQINETIFDTIIREAKEEANIAIKPKAIVGLRQRLTDQEGNNLWLVVIAKYLSGKAMPDNTEIGQAKFMLLAEAIKEPLTPVTKKILNLILHNKLQFFLPQKSLNKQYYTFFA